jgi:hypothetical protein
MSKGPRPILLLLYLPLPYLLAAANTAASIYAATNFSTINRPTSGDVATNVPCIYRTTCVDIAINCPAVDRCIGVQATKNTFYNANFNNAMQASVLFYAVDYNSASDNVNIIAAKRIVRRY